MSTESVKHRRAGRAGVALSFVSADQRYLVREIENITGHPMDPNAPPMPPDRHRKGGSRPSRSNRNIEGAGHRRRPEDPTQFGGGVFGKRRSLKKEDHSTARHPIAIAATAKAEAIHVPAALRSTEKVVAAIRAQAAQLSTEMRGAVIRALVVHRSIEIQQDATLVPAVHPSIEMAATTFHVQVVHHSIGIRKVAIRARVVLPSIEMAEANFHAPVVHHSIGTQEAAIHVRAVHLSTEMVPEVTHVQVVHPSIEMAATAILVLPSTETRAAAIRAQVVQLSTETALEAILVQVVHPSTETAATAILVLPSIETHAAAIRAQVVHLSTEMAPGEIHVRVVQILSETRLTADRARVAQTSIDRRAIDSTIRLEKAPAKSPVIVKQVVNLAQLEAASPQTHPVAASFVQIARPVQVASQDATTKVDLQAPNRELASPVKRNQHQVHSVRKTIAVVATQDNGPVSVCAKR